MHAKPCFPNAHAWKSVSVTLSQELTRLACRLAAEASDIVMAIRNGNLQIEYKAGDEPDYPSRTNARRTSLLVAWQRRIHTMS